MIEPSTSEDRFTVVAVLWAPATTAPLVIVTTTVLLPLSLKVSVPLSSLSMPLIANATAVDCTKMDDGPPIGVDEPLSTETLRLSLVS